MTPVDLLRARCRSTGGSVPLRSRRCAAAACDISIFCCVSGRAGRRSTDDRGNPDQVRQRHDSGRPVPKRWGGAVGINRHDPWAPRTLTRPSRLQISAAARRRLTLRSFHPASSKVTTGTTRREIDLRRDQARPPVRPGDRIEVEGCPADGAVRWCAGTLDDVPVMATAGALRIRVATAASANALAAHRGHATPGGRPGGLGAHTTRRQPGDLVGPHSRGVTLGPARSRSEPTRRQHGAAGRRGHRHHHQDRCA